MAQILTPSGYKDIASVVVDDHGDQITTFNVTVGDQVTAFNVDTGVPEINSIIKVELIDEASYLARQSPRWLINNNDEHYGKNNIRYLQDDGSIGLKRVDAVVAGDIVFWDSDGADEPSPRFVTVSRAIDEIVPFQWYRVNDKYLLFGDQSIWRNGTNVTHVSLLQVGDVLHDDQDRDVLITKIEKFTGPAWYRFHIDGDHSYIVDGLTLHNASRFWVGGNGNTWHVASGNTNWGTTSGGAVNASEPGTSDVAILDGGSGTGNSVISTAFTIQGLDCTGGTGSYAGTLTHNTSTTLTINTGAVSSLRFSAQMTYTPASQTSLITFTHTSGTANITCAGQKLWALTINGAGGTTQPLDTLLVNAGTNAMLTVTSGIFDANGGSNGAQAITCTLFGSSGSTTRSVILGGMVTLGGLVAASNAVWNCSTGTLLTFTKNSANITVLPCATSATTNILFDCYSGQTFNNVTFQAQTNPTVVQFPFSSATFANLTFNSGWSVALSGNTTTTILNGFTWTGTQANPIMVWNSNPAQVTSISCPPGQACTLTWGALNNVTGAGGATFTATDTLNGGNNGGWSISPPADASLTPAAIAAAVWKDLLAGADFGTSGSIGALLNQTDGNGFLKVDVVDIAGTASAGQAGYVAPDWGHVYAPTTTVGLSGTTIGTVTTATITSNIKKNTASNGFTFLMTDSTTNLPKTGLTVTSQVSIDGGAFAATTNSVTEVANGTYALNLSAADTNGNHLMLQFTATGASQLNVVIITQP